MKLGAAIISLCLLFGGGSVEKPLEVVADRVEVPILFFHHIDPEMKSDTTITPEKFNQVSAFLAKEGYTTITFEQLVAFVDGDGELPERPVILTFDDGYQSNLTYAAPILRERGQKATIFVIGVSVGKKEYKDTGIPILPHFSWEEAKEWSDVITLGSHTFDLHQSEYTDGATFRRGVLIKEGEDPALHTALIVSDLRKSMEETWVGAKQKVLAFAYPYGLHTDQTEAMLKQAGIRVSLLTSYGENNIVQGNPDSLYKLHRLEIFEDTNMNDLGLYLTTGVYHKSITSTEDGQGAIDQEKPH